MKLYPSFSGDKLLLVGAGILPWLYREKWILSDCLELETFKFGTTNKNRFPKEKLIINYDGTNLKVMNKKVVAGAMLSHQLHSWLTQWKEI